MSSDLVTCPRCAGFANAFARHGHVNAGRCLLCNGDLQVTRKQAAGFVGAMMRGAPAPVRQTPRKDAPVRVAERRTVVGGVECTIALYRGKSTPADERPEGATATEWFRLETDNPEAGLLVSTFVLVAGRVCEPMVCNGHLADFGGKRGFVQALETAHAAARKGAA